MQSQLQGLLPVPCKQPGPTTEQLQAKAEAKKAKKQRQKVNKQRQKASRPHPQQAQQAQHDTEAGAVEQAQHGEVAEQAQHGVVAVQARHVEQAQHVQHTEQAHHSEKTQDSFEAPQIQHTLTGQHDDVTLCCQDVHAWNSQSQTTSATQSSLPDDAARCETEDLCSGAEQDAIQQPQEPSPTDKLLSAAHPCHQETCVHTAALHQLDAYASQQGQMQTASQQPGHPASEQESDDAFLQQLVTCPITQVRLVRGQLKAATLFIVCALAS